MNEEIKRDIEKLTDQALDKRKKTQDKNLEFLDTPNAKKFKLMITNHIIPSVKNASIIIGRSGCSLNYYSNELAVIKDPNKRIFIQILFYPYGHSKITLGVNTPFLQFAFSPAKDNIKITTKISIKSDEPVFKIDECEIDELAQNKIDGYLLDFLKEVMTKDE